MGKERAAGAAGAPGAALDMVPACVREADAELARLGRSEAQVRLRVGELLDALFVRGGHHELGFSSIEAYVAERCRRNRRWGRDTRAVARRLRERGLHVVRAAVVSGRMSWSMAEVLARFATPEDQEALVAAAAGATVHAMQTRLSAAARARRQALDASEDAADPDDGAAADSTDDAPGAATDDDPDGAADDEPPSVRSVRWVSGAEVLMVQGSRMLVDYLTAARATDDALVTALLGEAETTLQALSDGAGEGVQVPTVDVTQLEALLRDRHLARAERSGGAGQDDDGPLPPRSVLVAAVDDPPLPVGEPAIDREIVARCRELAGRDLRIGRLARGILAPGSWRDLGWASAEQYARERVGLSLSSLEHRAVLARRVERYPALGVALTEGRIGYEAALLIGRVLGSYAAAALVDAWIERAGCRTHKHLREEVEATLLTVGLDRNASREPPGPDVLEAAAELERGVQSGALFRSLLGRNPGPQISVTLAAAPQGPGISFQPLRLTLPVELWAHWQVVEAQFRAVAGPTASFVAFLCLSLWSTWLPYLEARDDEWLEVYSRDRHRCTSPVCDRRDVTPHHVEFRAHGGSDDAGNMTSGCTWCHLDGIHGGRLTATGEAPGLRWRIGRRAVMVVEGREALFRP